MRVFLGGTCNNSTWRDQLITLLHNVDYFNPVVKDWTPECQAQELHEREICDIVLYTITPRMNGAYSVAEVVDDSNKRPAKTVFCFLQEDDVWIFTPAQAKSMQAVADLVARNGGQVFSSLREVADYLNIRAGA